MWFKCKHPAERLVLNEQETTTRRIDDDFSVTSISMHCYGCGKDVKVGATFFNGVVEAFINRGIQNEARSKRGS